jgi:hypothetical protein
MAADPLGALTRREDMTGAAEKLPACRIEIVTVMLVGEQHDIDRGDCRWLERGPGRLHEPARIFTRRREGWIGEPTETAVVDDRRGSAHEGDLEH